MAMGFPLSGSVDPKAKCNGHSHGYNDHDYSELNSALSTELSIGPVHERGNCAVSDI